MTTAPQTSPPSVTIPHGYRAAHQFAAALRPRGFALEGRVMLCVLGIEENTRCLLPRRFFGYGQSNSLTYPMVEGFWTVSAPPKCRTFSSATVPSRFAN